MVLSSLQEPAWHWRISLAVARGHVVAGDLPCSIVTAAEGDRDKQRTLLGHSEKIYLLHKQQRRENFPCA